MYLMEMNLQCGKTFHQVLLSLGNCSLMQNRSPLGILIVVAYKAPLGE